jgi:hypothetical protein
MIVVGGWPGRNVVGLNGRFGVRPADFGVGGEPNPFLNDVDPGDETTEFVGVVQTLPASGTVTFDDLGRFTHAGAADGSYITAFKLYTWAQGGPITEHTPDEEITTTFGATSDTGAGVTLTAAASLQSGAAAGSSGASAAGTTLTLQASLQAGAASGSSGSSAPGSTITVTATLVVGSASGPAGGTAAGAILTATLGVSWGGAFGPVVSPTRGFIARGKPRNYTSVFEP